MIKHRKFLGGGSASTKSHDKTREAAASVVLVGYKQKPLTEGRREVAVGTLVDSANTDVDAFVGSGGGNLSATSTSGISSSSNDLDAFELTLDGAESSPNGRLPIQSSGSVPFMAQLNGATVVGASAAEMAALNSAEAVVLLQQQQLQTHHLMLQDVPLSGVEPASSMTSNLGMQSSMSGSLPDLTNQEIVIDFPQQMTKSQQLMDQFQADSSNNILEAVESGEEEKISVYDLLVETMQVRICSAKIC